MPCIFCNSTRSPNPDGSCPDCGRIASPSTAATQQAVVVSSDNEEMNYPVHYWRCTWLNLLFKLINALVMGGILATGAWALFYYVDNAKLKTWEPTVWYIVIAIPAVYFLLGFVFFVYKWFIKKYELHPRDIRLIKGFFNVSTNSTLLEALWGMKLRQNFLQILLGTGKITLFSDDVTSPVLYINDIGNIRKRFKDLIRYQDYALDCSNVMVERDVNTDTSIQVWRYSWRDLIDETIWGVVITTLLVLAGYFIPWGNAYLRFSILLIIPVLYWCWLIWTFIDKICCTKYTLNNATLVKESGIFYKKIDVYVLCHIRDCEMSQNLWQRIVGDVGNITLYLKWENKDASEDHSGSLSTTKKDVLHGLKDHIAKYDTFKNRWLRERHRRQA